MFSFNQPNCITSCPLCEMLLCRAWGTEESAGTVPREREGLIGVFPLCREILKSILCCMYVQECLLHGPSWHCPFSGSSSVLIEGQTEDRQGAQTDDVILVLNASSTLRASSALKAGHSPSWVMLSLIRSTALDSSFLSSSSSSQPTPVTSSSFFPLHRH